MITSGGICIVLVILVLVFRSSVACLLGARNPVIQQMTSAYILGYLVGFPFFTLTKTLTPFLQTEGQYKRVNITSLLACFSLIFHSVVYNFNSYLMPIKRIRFSCLYSFLIECG